MEAWTNRKGLDTSKAYEYFRPKRTRQPWQTAIWKAFIPPKYSFVLDYGEGLQHVTDCRSFKRKKHVRFASTDGNQPGTYSLSAHSVTLCGPISGTGLASVDVCQPFSAQ
ncbi:UNVERIFIED_CONTAM: hypothetical protein Slati_1906700 [Sesamum latifolium]|uniref:Uncharacterized protein n=1 Tax=Sesamum latifolium TaxID=2727402 RepID=A0AAW2X266_9LAMI